MATPPGGNATPASSPDAVERVALAEVTHLMAVGEPLPFRVFDAVGRLLLNEGHRLHGPAQLEALIERGAWVERAVVAALLAKPQADSPDGPGSARPVSLFDRWDQAMWELDALLKAVVAGRPAADGLRRFADRVVELVDRDPDIALFVAHRQDDRRFALYPLSHAVHCAGVAVLASRVAGWPADRQRAIVCAALTMNVSILDLQAQMAEQKEPPSRRQLERIRAHPETAAAMLEAAGVSDPLWLETVATHHEVPGGSGYPRALAAVADEARLLRHADVYLAKVTPRAMRPALPPRTAAAQLYQQSAGEALAVSLIKSVGVHPPGTLVQLASGEVAVVIRRAASGPAPLVSTLSDRTGRPVVVSTVRQTQEAAYAIVGPPPDPSAFARVLPERVYGWMPG